MASNYSRIQINLLPPELKPGPSVRFGVLLNFLFIASTVAFILIHSVTSLNRLASYKEASQEMEKQIAQYQVNETYYNELIEIKNSVESYGRLISMASVDYVEMPLILERMSSITPDGVYLRAVANDKPAEGSDYVVVHFQFSASKDDPALVGRTLNAFKNDKYLHDCYMSNADTREQGIQDRLEMFGINWGATGSRAEDASQLLTNLIEFEIQARVKRPLETEGLPRTMDSSEKLTQIKFLTPPPAEEKGKKKKASSGGSKPRSEMTKEERKAEEVAAANSGGLPPTITDGEGN